jgi:apolipoprotein N-acyltransferase
LVFQSANNRDIILSTIFLSASFAPSPFGFIVFFAFLPQLRIYTRNSVTDSIICGYIIGLLTNMIVLYWVANYDLTYYILGVFINALKFLIFAAIISIIAQYNRTGALAIFPFLWTSLEFIREKGPLAFSWLNISQTQSSYLSLIQFAEFTGNLGIVFWICIINLILLWIVDFRQIRLKRYSLLTALFLLFLLPLLLSWFLLSRTYISKGISTAYVQPNIEEKMKLGTGNLSVLIAESQQLCSYKPDLTIWPETALPFYLDEDSVIIGHFNRWLIENHLNVLTGTMDRIGVRRYNTAIMISPAEAESPQIYHKLMPVPMAETGIWGTAVEAADFSRGEEYTVFTINVDDTELIRNNKLWKIKRISNKSVIAPFSVLICFETAFADLTRNMVDRGAQLLVFITNDQAFGYSSQPYQHLAIARIRAIENRISIVQCANTGISAFIDPFGRIFNQSQLYTKKTAVRHLPLRWKKTFYTLYGHLIGWILVVLTILAAVIIIVQPSKNEKT